MTLLFTAIVSFISGMTAMQLVMNHHQNEETKKLHDAIAGEMFKLEGKIKKL